MLSSLVISSRLVVLLLQEPPDSDADEGKHCDTTNRDTCNRTRGETVITAPAVGVIIVIFSRVVCRLGARRRRTRLRSLTSYRSRLRRRSSNRRRGYRSRVKRFEIALVDVTSDIILAGLEARIASCESRTAGSVGAFFQVGALDGVFLTTCALLVDVARVFIVSVCDVRYVGSIVAQGEEVDVLAYTAPSFAEVLLT